MLFAEAGDEPVMDLVLTLVVLHGSGKRFLSNANRHTRVISLRGVDVLPTSINHRQPCLHLFSKIHHSTGLRRYRQRKSVLRLVCPVPRSNFLCPLQNLQSRCRMLLPEGHEDDTRHQS